MPRPAAVSNAIHAVDDAVGLGPAARSSRQSRGFVPRERLAEHVLDAVAALDRLEVPGERDEVAPEAVLEEQRGGGRGVARGQRLVEAREPLVDRGGGLDGGVAHGLLLTDGWCGPSCRSARFARRAPNALGPAPAGAPAGPRAGRTSRARLHLARSRALGRRTPDEPELRRAMSRRPRRPALLGAVASAVRSLFRWTGTALRGARRSGLELARGRRGGQCRRRRPRRCRSPYANATRARARARRARPSPAGPRRGSQAFGHGRTVLSSGSWTTRRLSPPRSWRALSLGWENAESLLSRLPGWRVTLRAMHDHDRGLSHDLPAHHAAGGRSATRHRRARPPARRLRVVGRAARRDAPRRGRRRRLRARGDGRPLPRRRLERAQRAERERRRPPRHHQELRRRLRRGRGRPDHARAQAARRRRRRRPAGRRGRLPLALRHRAAATRSTTRTSRRRTTSAASRRATPTASSRSRRSSRRPTPAAGRTSTSRSTRASTRRRPASSKLRTSQIALPEGRLRHDLRDARLRAERGRTWRSTSLDERHGLQRRLREPAREGVRRRRARHHALAQRRRLGASGARRAPPTAPRRGRPCPSGPRASARRGCRAGTTRRRARPDTRSPRR